MPASVYEYFMNHFTLGMLEHVGSDMTLEMAKRYVQVITWMAHEAGDIKASRTSLIQTIAWMRREDKVLDMSAPSMQVLRAMASPPKGIIGAVSFLMGKMSAGGMLPARYKHIHPYYKGFVPFFRGWKDRAGQQSLWNQRQWKQFVNGNIHKTTVQAECLGKVLLDLNTLCAQGFPVPLTTGEAHRLAQVLKDDTSLYRLDAMWGQPNVPVVSGLDVLAMAAMLSSPIEKTCKSLLRVENRYGYEVAHNMFSGTTPGDLILMADDDVDEKFDIVNDDDKDNEAGSIWPPLRLLGGDAL